MYIDKLAKIVLLYLMVIYLKFKVVTRKFYSIIELLAFIKSVTK
jgi:hypothetical protein